MSLELETKSKQQNKMSNEKLELLREIEDLENAIGWLQSSYDIPISRISVLFKYSNQALENLKKQLKQLK